MLQIRKSGALVGLLCLVCTLATAACGGDSSAQAESAHAGWSDAESTERDAGDTDMRDIGAQDADAALAGSYRSIFAGADGEAFFVTYHTDEGVQLFGLDVDGVWSEVQLPEPLRGEPLLVLTSVVTTEYDLLLSTRGHGAWRRQRDDAQWQAFNPDWFDGSGQITHLKKLRDRIYAFHEVEPNSPTGIELWQRRQLDWEYIRNDMFMIIDYMPREEMSVRATRYGSIEVSYDAGETWQAVPEVRGTLPPQLFEWGESVAVMTTSGVWLTSGDANNWEKLAIHGGEAGALLGDELVVANRSGEVSAVSLADMSVRELPALDPSIIQTLQLGVVGERMVVATGHSEMLQFSAASQQWEQVDPHASISGRPGR
jgi:hypothetical protein